MRASIHATLHGRNTRHWHAILEHASPVLGSGLGKIGQAGQQGIVKHGRGCMGLGARGAGR